MTKHKTKQKQIIFPHSKWKRYEQFTLCEGWHNVAYPRHLGSFCYGALCLLLGLPTLLYFAWNPSVWRAKTGKIPPIANRRGRFSVRELTAFGHCSPKDFAEHLPSLAKRFSTSRQNRIDTIQYTIERSHSAFSARKKMECLLEDKNLHPFFTEASMRNEMEKAFFARFERPFWESKEDAA